MIIIVRVLGLFMGRATIGKALATYIGSLFGPEALASLQQTIRSFRAVEHTYLISGCLFVFLLYIATSLFNGVRNAINELWCIRTIPETNIRANMRSRVAALLVILVGALLLLGVEILFAEQDFIGHYLKTGNASVDSFINQLVHAIITAGIALLWFFLLFIVLPDGKAARKIAMVGAATTAVLFTIGKALMAVLMRPVQINNIYGVSGAIALVLLFMFYSSLILYFGSALIRAISEAKNKQIIPKEYAERYRLVSDQSNSTDR